MIEFISLLGCLILFPCSRYSVENIPLYDSAEDEPTSKLSKDIDSSKNVPFTKPDPDNVMELDNGLELVQCSHSEAIDVEPLNSIRMEDMVIDEVKLDTSENRNMFSQDTHTKLVHKNAMISRIQSNSACRNYHIDTSIVSRASVPHFSGGKTKNLAQKQVEAKVVGQLLASKEAREEVFAYEVQTVCFACIFFYPFLFIYYYVKHLYAGECFLRKSI